MSRRIFRTDPELDQFLIRSFGKNKLSNIPLRVYRNKRKRMLFEKVMASFHKHPTRKCINWYTYNDVYQLTKKYEGILKKHHVGRKDRVCWDAPKSPHWPAVLLATWMRGAVFVPLNHGNQLLNDHIVRTVKPKVILNDKVVGLYQYIDVSDEEYVDADSASTILFTSGTASQPKGVVISHKNIWTNLHQICRRGVMILTIQIPHFPSCRGIIVMGWCVRCCSFCQKVPTSMSQPIKGRRSLGK